MSEVRLACDVCRRSHDTKKRPFYCAVDVRNLLYERRVSHVHHLLETEKLETKINAFLIDNTESKSTLTDPAEQRQARLHRIKAEHEQTLESIDRVQVQVDKLQKQIAAHKEMVAQKKELLTRRKANLTSVSDGLEQRRKNIQYDTVRSTTSLNIGWNVKHDKMVATRSFLCLESAKLFGLRVKRGPTPQYYLGGIEVLGLQSLNDAEPELVSTSLAHVAHILVLASHYLALKLPAEITTPHTDYPRPTIFPIESSYQPGRPQFPSSQPVLELEDRFHSRRARARPLYLEKPLKKLARDDPVAYSLFLEGVSLLAYDIVWACTTQGVHTGEKDSIEDFCNFGRNLYNLLIGHSLHTNSAGRIYQIASTSSPSRGAVTNSSGPGNGIIGVGGDMVIQPTMGRFSHGAAHDNLVSAEGTEFLKRSKPRLPSPIKMADKLKRKLNPTPEWELLEHPDSLEDTVMIEGSVSRVLKAEARERRPSFGIESLMSEINPPATKKGGRQASFGTDALVENGVIPSKIKTTRDTSMWTRLTNR